MARRLRWHLPAFDGLRLVRIAPLVLIVSTFAVALFLTGFRQSRPSFSISAQASAISLELAGQAFSDAFQSNSVAFDYVDQVLCDGETIAAAGSLSIPVETKRAGVAAGAPVMRERITVEQIVLPAASRIYVRRAEGDVQMRVEPAASRGTQSEISMMVPEAAIAGRCRGEALAGLRQLEIKAPAGRPLLITFGGIAPEQRLFARLSIKSIRFIETIEVLPRGTATNQTLISGSLWIENLGFREPPIGPLDGIIAEGLDDGVARLLSVSGASLSIAAAGRARSLDNFQAEKRIDLRPTLFDQLSKVTALRLVFAMIAFLAGLQFSNFIYSRTGKRST